MIICKNNTVIRLLYLTFGEKKMRQPAPVSPIIFLPGTLPLSPLLFITFYLAGNCTAPWRYVISAAPLNAHYLCLPVSLILPLLLINYFLVINFRCQRYQPVACAVDCLCLNSLPRSDTIAQMCTCWHQRTQLNCIQQPGRRYNRLRKQGTLHW